MNGTALWAPLDAELEAWRQRGLVATLWWRDDDAGDVDPALERLLALSAAHGIPLVLATVPAWATAALGARIRAAGPLVTVVQHGYAHLNHSPPGAGKQELGPERPAAFVVAELAQGWQQLEALFGSALFPAMVPPWNRMIGYLPPYLAELRYRGLSQFGARNARCRVRGLVQCNTHVDIVYWKSPPPRFGGAEKQVAAFAEHLAGRRAGAVVFDEPTGLLTHHLAHDEDCWAFLAAFFARYGRHPATAWLPAAAVFADGATR